MSDQDDQNGQSLHTVGLDAISGRRALLIQVRDVQALVRAKGGAAGDFAQKIMPDTIADQVYSEMAKKMSEGLKAEGVDADVRVVSPAGYQPAGVNAVYKPLAIGSLSLLGGLGLWKLTSWIIHRGRASR